MLLILLGVVALTAPLSVAQAAPAAEPSADAVALSKKLQVDSGFKFIVPPNSSWDPKADGELQIETGDLFLAIITGDGLDATFDKTIGLMKAIGGADFKADADPKMVTEGDAKGKLQTGTVPIKGRTFQFMVVVFDRGKKALRVAALCPDLKTNADFKAFLSSLK